MSDVTLSASVRQSLLSLQGTTDLIERTQNRLSTGLRVSSVIDDPVSFFQARSLNNRSSDFLERRDGIDQGISTVTAALDGIEAIEQLVQQAKGIANSIKSATDAQVADLVTQFNDLRTQLNNLTADATYQGTNLINGTGQQISIEFSERSASLLNIASVNLRTDTAGLNIAVNSYFTQDNTVTHSAISRVSQGTNTFGDRFLTTTSDFSLSYQGSAKTFSAGETFSFTYGTGSSFTLTVSTAQALTLAQNGTITVNVASASTDVAAGTVGLLTTGSVNASFTVSAETLAATTGTADNKLITYNGNSTVTLTSGDTFTFQITGGGGRTLQVLSGQTFVLSQGESFTTSVLSTGAGLSQVTGATFFRIGSAQTVAITAANTGSALVNGLRLGAAISANGGEINFTGLVRAGDTTRINAVISQLDTALTSLRTQAQTLGSNVALLNARLDFTENYVNTLQGGADKLTLADINSEGANLLALQTRQQLGIQSLSLAAQAEASILSLFG
jgi:flagellin